MMIVAPCYCLLQVMEDTMWSSSSPEYGSAEDCYTDEVDNAKFSKPMTSKSKSSSCKGTAENLLNTLYECKVAS